MDNIPLKYAGCFIDNNGNITYFVYDGIKEISNEDILGLNNEFEVYLGEEIGMSGEIRPMKRERITYRLTLI